jgi:hypothetical protein
MRRNVFADRPYTVSLHDNDLSHGDTTPLGVVTTAAEALDLALDAVDRQLLVRPLHRATPDALYAPFVDWGQSPCIDHGPTPLPFDADTYARRLCAAVAGLPPDEAPDAARALREAYRAECLSPPRLDTLCQSDLPSALQPGARWPVLLALRFTADTGPTSSRGERGRRGGRSFSGLTIRGCSRAPSPTTKHPATVAGFRRADDGPGPPAPVW